MTRAHLAVVVPFLVLVGLASACREPSVRDPGFQPSPTPRTTATMLRRGIDVSADSGMVDWERVGIAGLSFALVRATDGTTRDPLFEQNWLGLSRTGLVRGVVHRFDPLADPGEQARAFLEAVELESGDLVPAVEVRPAPDAAMPPDVADRLGRLLARLEEEFGATPIVYTDAASWNRVLPDTFGSHPLWVVDHKAQTPALPHGWDGWYLWVFRENRIFNGVDEPVNISAGNTRREDLDRILLR